MPAPSEPALISIELTLNGESVRIDIDPRERLLDTLRYRLALTGTKEGCGEGECGACAVVFNGTPANSCLIPAAQCAGATIDTVENIKPETLDTLLASGATQCGACTPGVAVTACWVRTHPELLQTHSLRELMAGNLCRCTGYDGIIEGVAASMRPPKGSGS